MAILIISVCECFDKCRLSNQIRSVTTHAPSNPEAKSRNFERVYRHNTQTHLEFAAVEFNV
jgi:hypothetical protein